MVLEGSPNQIREQFGAPVCQITMDSLADLTKAQTELLPTGLGVDADRFSNDGLVLSFTTSHGVDDLSKALGLLSDAGLQVHSAALNAPSLDDVFLDMAFQNDQAEVKA